MVDRCLRALVCGLSMVCLVVSPACDSGTGDSDPGTSGGGGGGGSTDYGGAGDDSAWDDSGWDGSSGNSSDGTSSSDGTNSRGASATSGCTDSCEYANDGACDDGGPGAEYDPCALGTDCGDCGPREIAGSNDGTDDSGGADNGSDGSDDGSDGSTDGSDGSTDGSDDGSEGTAGVGSWTGTTMMHFGMTSGWGPSQKFVTCSFEAEWWVEVDEDREITIKRETARVGIGADGVEECSEDIGVTKDVDATWVPGSDVEIEADICPALDAFVLDLSGDEVVMNGIFGCFFQAESSYGTIDIQWDMDGPFVLERVW